MNTSKSKVLLIRVLILSALCLFLLKNTFSQKTVVKGRLTEGGSGDPIAFANIYFKNSTIGSISDTNGFYLLETDKVVDSIVVSVLGYTKVKKPVQSNKEQTIDFVLTSNVYDLSEVVINPGENPAWAVLRKVISKKDENRPKNKGSLQYEEYSKIQFDLNHFTEKIKNNIILRPFDFIWDHVDSTEEGVAYLPILLIENISDHYFQSEGNKHKEVIKAQSTSGFEGPKIMEFVQDMYLEPDFYDNYILLLEKNFPSPLNDNYKSNYRFYLTDSILENGELFYKIVFKPRSFNAQAFQGQMLIHKGSYALKDIEVRFDIQANINFVRSYWIKQTFKSIEGNWIRTESKLLGDFTVLENQSDMTGFFGRKSTSIKNIKVNTPIPDSVFRGIDEKKELENSESRSNEFWDTHRHEELSNQEKEIYSMVKEVEEHPAFILRKNIVETIWNGYYPKKYIDLGDVYTFYSYNQVEYSRVKLGFRTNETLFKNTVIGAFGAYGDRDQQFKYGGYLDHTFQGRSNRFFRIGGLYQYDIEQLGWSYNFIPIDHLIASLIQINISKTRTYNERTELYLERQWFTGFSTRLTGFIHEVTPTADITFNISDSTGAVSTVDAFNRGGLKLGIRFAPGVKSSNADYYSPTHRWNFGTIPIISLEYAGGLKDQFTSEFDFQEIKVRLDHRFKTKKWGYTNYMIEAGKIWGTLPYHFLQIPLGNEVVFNDKIAYNLMNYLEFINDEFAQIQVEHHFEGILLGTIPLINKTKLRSFVFGKVMAGRVSQENNSNEFIFAAGSQGMIEPYYETGFGIENILKIARVDFIWRLNYLDNANIYPFIVKPSFQFNF